MEQNKEYYAFISYKREDEKWAKWLQHKLEHYKFPTNLNGRTDLPKRIYPTFRDVTDLTPGLLAEEIDTALRNSQWLIVVCSPRSAKSPWVCKEAQTFIDLGRADHIIPFVIEGNPFSKDSDTECYPEALLNLTGSKELVAANINELGRNAAAIKVIARMFGLKFDVLWQRYKKYILKKSMIIVSSALFVCCIGLMYWCYTKPMYKYYADYVDVFGIPKGVVELEKSIVKHRDRSYRFEYRRIPLGEPGALSWRLSKVEYVNSIGQPHDYLNPYRTDRFAIQKFEYDNLYGTIKNIDFCDKFGKTLLRCKVSSREGIKATLIDYLGVSDLNASGYLFSSIVPNYSSDLGDPNWGDYFPKSTIKRCVLTRDSNGYVTSRSFHENNSDDIESSKTTDTRGVYKQVFVNDSTGRVISTTCYDINNNIVHGDSKVAVIKYDYDKWSNLRCVEYCNSKLKPTLNELLCAKITFECDRWGNIIKSTCFGIDGERCYSINNVSQTIDEYDDKGYPVSTSFLDTKSRSCLNSDGVSKICVKCDRRGNQIEKRYEGISGKSCVDKYGVARINMDYDRWGNCSYIAFFGLNGNLIRIASGVSGWRMKHDKLGNTFQYDCFGEDWNACANKAGVACTKSMYDDRGFQTQYAYYDVKGNKTICADGYYLVKNEFGDRGNLEETLYYGVDELPCLTKRKFHKVKNLYDKFGNLIETKYYNTKGSLCNADGYFAVVKYKPDSSGNVVKMEFYDSLGIKKGILQSDYDDMGRKVCQKYSLIADSLIQTNEAPLGFTIKYDVRGNEIEKSFFDANGNSCCDQFGVARYVDKYDDKSNKYFSATYDSKNHLVALNEGVALWESEFNDRGLEVRTTYFDENKSRCFVHSLGYACKTIKYNEKCDPVEVCTYDENGDLCVDSKEGYARWVAVYDTNGNKIKMLSYSSKDSLCVCKYGYAKWVAKYDKDNNQIENLSYDEKGNLISTLPEKKIENPAKDVRNYDPHRFEYEIWQVVFGFVLLGFLILAIFLWFSHVLTNDFKDNFWYFILVISLLGLVYSCLRVFLLHYALIPYDLYNYSWILNLVSALGNLMLAIFLVSRLFSSISHIIRAPKSERKSLYKDSSIELLCLFLFLPVASVFQLLEDTWIIYSTPL